MGIFPAVRLGGRYFCLQLSYRELLLLRSIGCLFSLTDQVEERGLEIQKALGVSAGAWKDHSAARSWPLEFGVITLDLKLCLAKPLCSKGKCTCGIKQSVDQIGANPGCPAPAIRGRGIAWMGCLT